MYQKIVTVRNESGLHARPASVFTAEAKRFQSAVTIRRAGGEAGVNAKSMVKLLALGICKGQPVELTAEGPDEAEAVEALAALIEQGFGE